MLSIDTLKEKLRELDDQSDWNRKEVLSARRAQLHRQLQEAEAEAKRPAFEALKKDAEEAYTRYYALRDKMEAAMVKAITPMLQDVVNAQHEVGRLMTRLEHAEFTGPSMWSGIKQRTGEPRNPGTCRFKTAADTHVWMLKTLGETGLRLGLAGKLTLTQPPEPK